MKNKAVTKKNKKAIFREWAVRIFAILLVAFMLIGSFYYALFFLFA